MFANTSGVVGTNAGDKFHCSDSLWSCVANFIQNLTGAPFQEVATHHILDPLGLSGSFDANTKYPTFTARVFLGTNQDLLLLGSTLASGGVSPKTRLRVISTSSVNTMLNNWTAVKGITESFYNDETAQSMKRFVDGDEP